MDATFESLLIKIAREQMALKVYGFTPIGLVGSVHEILAKVLASRLWTVIVIVVGPNQQAFFLISKF